MAASRTTLLLLGLVVLATVLVAADAHGTCRSCGELEDLKLALKVNTKKCSLAVRVLVEGVVKADRGKAIKVCKGRKVTVLDPLRLHLKVRGMVSVKVELLDRYGKVVLKAWVKLDLAEVVVDVVGDLYVALLDVVLDVEHKRLLFLSADVELNVLGLVNVDLDVLLGPGLPIGGLISGLPVGDLIGGLP